MAGRAWRQLFYAVAGAAMVASAALLVLATLTWALAEVGLDRWQLVPRGEVIFILGGLLVTPWIARRVDGSGWVRTAGPLAASLALAAIVAVASMLASSPKQWEGTLPGPRAPAPVAQNALPPGDWFAYGGD